MTYRRRSGECDLECCDGPVLRDKIVRLQKAISDCIDSLEYVDRPKPGAGGSTGYGVRAARIQKARQVLEESKD